MRLLLDPAKISAHLGYFWGMRAYSFACQLSKSHQHLREFAAWSKWIVCCRFVGILAAGLVEPIESGLRRLFSEAFSQAKPRKQIAISIQHWFAQEILVLCTR